MKEEKIFLNELYQNRKIKSPLVFTILVFFIPYVIFCFAIQSTFPYRTLTANKENLITFFIATLWLIAGPYSTYCVFENIKKLQASLPYLEDTRRSNQEFYNKCVKLYKIVVLILTIIWTIPRYQLFRNCTIVKNLTESLSWQSNVIFIVYVFLSFLQAYGFAALILVYGVIKQIINTPGKLKSVLNANYSTGLRPLGDLIIIVLLCCATGALYFPLYLLIVSNDEKSKKMMVLGMILFFVVFLVVSLFYLYYIVRKAAKSAKSEIVGEYSKLYYDKINDSKKYKENNALEGIRLELQIQNFYRLYEDAGTINVNPIDIQAFTTAFGTIIIPVVVYFKDIVGFVRTTFIGN